MSGDRFSTRAWISSRKQKSQSVATLAAASPFVAQVLPWRRQFEEAFGLQQRFLPQARSIGDLQFVVPALAVAALIASM